METRSHVLPNINGNYIKCLPKKMETRSHVYLNKWKLNHMPT